METYPFSILLSIAVMHLVAVISPGSNFVVVSQTAIQHSRSRGFLTAMGVAAGAMVWSSLAMMGLRTLLFALPVLFGGLKLVGGTYLLYLGWKSWIDAPKPLAQKSVHQEQNGFWLGLGTNLTNPASVIFFSTIFATQLVPGLPLWVKFAAVSIVVLNALIWYGFVAFAFSSPVAQTTYRSAKSWIDRLTAAAMFYFGLRLIWSAVRR